MKKVSRSRTLRNARQLDLFEWAQQHRNLSLRDSLMVRSLRRKGVRTSTARLIAHLNGFPTEEGQS